jgi:hypothetical protein
VQRFFAIPLICFSLLTASAWAPRAATLVMPQELVEYAQANGCNPIDNFYDRPGMVNPPFAYGWLTGAPEESAVFWCQKMEKSDKPWELIFKVKDAKQMAGCPAIVEWWNGPRGLSIEVQTNFMLSNFRYVNEPKRSGPASTIARAKVIVDYYDGLESIFYCDQGQWLYRNLD